MISDSMVSFDECFELVDDPRLLARTTHPLHTILFIVVAATICGADGPEDMEKFATRKRTWLERFVDLKFGMPSHDTIGRVLSLIKPKQFQDAFLNWVSSLSSFQDQDGKPIFIPLDGKTVRGSYQNADKSDMLHIVSAWASQQGMTLGQVAVDSKSNECHPRIAGIAGNAGNAGVARCDCVHRRDGLPAGNRREDRCRRW